MTPNRVKKWTRTRTGCFACRQRRIKCDEAKPVCRRCLIGSHKCIYPRPIETANTHTHGYNESLALQSHRSPTTEDDRFSDSSDSEGECSLQITSPSTRHNDTVSLGPLDYSADASLSQQFQTAFLSVQFRKKELPIVDFPMDIYSELDSSAMNDHLPCLYRAPHSVHEDLIPFFLSYHQQHINYGRYFWYSDYHGFIKESLLDLAKQSDSLKYAVVAFSALIYSIQVNHHVKQYAFHFYAKTIRELQHVINTDSMKSVLSLHTTVATILELASIERVIADVVKCFRHVQGAALIFQTSTTAAQLCASATGRLLFQWYNHIEDECCLLLSCRGAMPNSWRQDDIQIRKLVLESNVSPMSEKQRQSWILDDVLQTALAITPTAADVLATIPELKGSTGEKRAKMIVYLESKLVYILDYLEALRTTPIVEELLQTIEVGFPWQSRHSSCCPDLPFPPFRFINPSAGMVFICLTALRLYAQVVLYPPLRADGVRFERLELESKFDEYYACEMLRGYAAIEDEVGDDLSYLLSCFRPLVVAGFSCPVQLRQWLWYKFAHFEQLGPKYVEPVRRYLSVLWGMPGILTLSFESWKRTPLENRIAPLTVDDIEVAAKIVVTTTDLESSETVEE